MRLGCRKNDVFTLLATLLTKALVSGFGGEGYNSFHRSGKASSNDYNLLKLQNHLLLVLIYLLSFFQFNFKIYVMFCG